MLREQFALSEETDVSAQYHSYYFYLLNKYRKKDEGRGEGRRREEREREIFFFVIIIEKYRYNGKMGIARITSDADLEALMLKLSASETHQFLVFAVEPERTRTHTLAYATNHTPLLSLSLTHSRVSLPFLC
jgi:hypothetical protein